MRTPPYHETYDAAEVSIFLHGQDIDVATGFEEEDFNGKSTLLRLKPEVLTDLNPFRPERLGRIASMQVELYPWLSDTVPSLIVLTCEHAAADPLDNTDDVVMLQQAYSLFQQHRKNKTVDLATTTHGHPSEWGEDESLKLKPDDYRFATLALASIARHYPTTL